MNDLGLKVMIGAVWAFGVLNVAPEIVAVLVERGAVPSIPGVAPNWSEFLYVVALALLGPLALWLLTRRKRAAEWKEFDQ